METDKKRVCTLIRTLARVTEAILNDVLTPLAPEQRRAVKRAVAFYRALREAGMEWALTDHLAKSRQQEGCDENTGG